MTLEIFNFDIDMEFKPRIKVLSSEDKRALVKFSNKLGLGHENICNQALMLSREGEILAFVKLDNWKNADIIEKVLAAKQLDKLTKPLMEELGAVSLHNFSKELIDALILDHNGAYKNTSAQMLFTQDFMRGDLSNMPPVYVLDILSKNLAVPSRTS